MTHSFPTRRSSDLIIDPTAQRFIGVRLAVYPRINAITVGIGKIIAKHACADTANVKAPHLRFTKEEPVRQANLIDLVACAIVALLFQRVNIPGLATQRENETSAHIPELVCIDPATNI